MINLTTYFSTLSLSGKIDFICRILGLLVLNNLANYALTLLIIKLF